MKIWFGVSHVRSGLSVALFPDPEAALSGAQALGGLLPGGWTLAGDEVCGLVTRFDVIDAAGRWGGQFGSAGRGDRSDMAVTA